MPYLPVDIDGKRKAEEIERSLGVPRLSVVGGLVDLWETVWRSKMAGKPPEVAAVVDELAMGAAFGPDARVRSALVAREFLEPVPGGWRVRGAAKWLFGLEGKSRGGKSAKGNLKRGSQPGSQPGIETPMEPGSPAKPGPKPGPMPEDTSRLTSRLLHPAPSTQLKEEVPQAAPTLPIDPLRAPWASTLPGFEESLTPDRRKSTDPPNVFRLQEQRVEPPPKKLSRQQEFAGYFWGCRDEHLAESGLPPSQDTGWTIQLQNVRLAFVKQSQAELLAHAVRAYLDNEKMRDKDPPWPLHFFVSDFGKYESLARKQVAS